MDSAHEDVSARVILKNVIYTEPIRTPLTHRASPQQIIASMSRCRVNLYTNEVAARMTPGQALKLTMKQKLLESSSKAPTPPSKRRTRSSVTRKINMSAPAASLLYDDDITPKHLLKGILRTEQEMSLLVQNQPRGKILLPSTDSSLNSNCTSLGLSGLDLPDLTVDLANTVNRLSRKRPHRSLDVSMFEKKLRHDVDKGDSTDNMSGISSTSLSLKTPCTDPSSEKKGLQRKVANRRKVNVEEFDANVQSRQTDEDPEQNFRKALQVLGETVHSEGFTLGMSDLAEPDVTNNVAFNNTALYASTVTMGSFSMVTQDTTSATEIQKGKEEIDDDNEKGELDKELKVKKKFELTGKADLEEDVDCTYFHTEKDAVESQIKDTSAAESQTDGEDASDSQTDGDEAVESQIDRKEVTQSQTDGEEAVESQIDRKEVSQSQTDGQEVAQSQIDGAEAADSETDGEEAADSQTDGEEVAQSQIDGAEAADSQTDGEEVAQSQIDGEEAVDSQTDGEEVAQSQINGAEAADSQTDGEEAADSQTDGEEVAQSQIDGAEAADSQTDEEEVAQSQIDGEEAADSQTDGEEVSQSQINGAEAADSQTDGEEVAQSQIDGEEAVDSQTDGEEVAQSQINGAEAADSQTDEEEVAQSQIDGEEVEESHIEENGPDGSQSREHVAVIPQSAQKEHAELHFVKEDHWNQGRKITSQRLPHDTEHTSHRAYHSDGGVRMHAVMDGGRYYKSMGAGVHLRDVTDEGDTADKWPNGSDVRASGSGQKMDEDGDETDLSQELSMKTPTFVREKRRRVAIEPADTVPKTNITNISTGNSAAVKPKTVRTKQASSAKKKTGLPKTYLMSVFKHFAKTNVSADVYPILKEIMDKYFDRLADDLETFAAHAQRKTIEVEDVELLLRRQGFVTDSMPVNVLIEKYLPMEYRKLLIPVATSGNHVIPKRRR